MQIHHTLPAMPAGQNWPGSGISRALFDEIMGRLESLESRVDELEGRKAYMKEYMRKKRAEEKG